MPNKNLSAVYHLYCSFYPESSDFFYTVHRRKLSYTIEEINFLHKPENIFIPLSGVCTRICVSLVGLSQMAPCPKLETEEG